MLRLLAMLFNSTNMHGHGDTLSFFYKARTVYQHRYVFEWAHLKVVQHLLSNVFAEINWKRFWTEPTGHLAMKTMCQKNTSRTKQKQKDGERRLCSLILNLSYTITQNVVCVWMRTFFFLLGGAEDLKYFLYGSPANTTLCRQSFSKLAAEVNGCIVLVMTVK